jgi:hypothetical protein
LFTHYHASSKSATLDIADFSKHLKLLGAQKDLIMRLCPRDILLTDKDDEIVNQPKIDRLERRWRLVSIIDACLKIDLLEHRSIPAFFVLLLLIALDPSTTSEIQRKIMVTLMRIVQSPGFSVQREIETLRLITSMTSGYSGTQKRMLLDMMPSYNRSGLRMTQWIGFETLVGKTLNGIDENTYLALPSLDKLQALVEGSPDFHISAEMDYEDLRDRTEILSYILTDVEGYMDQERNPKRPHLSAPGGTSTSKFLNLCNSLHYLHDQIAEDTKAAYLDRTEAKDALQRLRMRIYYQYKADVGHKAAVASRRGPLIQWFSAKKGR